MVFLFVCRKYWGVFKNNSNHEFTTYDFRSLFRLIFDKIFDFTDLQIKHNVNELKTNIAAQLCSMAVEKDVLDGKPCWKAFLLNFTAASKQSKTLIEKVCNSIGQN